MSGCTEKFPTRKGEVLPPPPRRNNYATLKQIAIKQVRCPLILKLERHCAIFFFLYELLSNNVFSCVVMLSSIIHDTHVRKEFNSCHYGTYWSIIPLQLTQNLSILV